MLPSLICLILRHLEDPASTAQYHLLPNAILPPRRPYPPRRVTSFWRQALVDITLSLGIITPSTLPSYYPRISTSDFWASDLFGLSTHRLRTTPPAFTTVYRLYRTGHPRASSHSLPHHRYPAYCWVSRRHWHSYPIVGAPGALASRPRRGLGYGPFRSFPVHLTPTRLRLR